MHDGANSGDGLTNISNQISQNPTAGNVGQRNATVQAANNQANAVVNQEDVAKSLRSKDISLQKVDGIAEAIRARLNGQELTRTPKYILSSALNSSVVRDTISDIMNSRKPALGQQSIEQRYHESSETTILPEHYEISEKTGGIDEHGEEAELVFEWLSASSKEIKQILGVDDSRGLKQEVNRSIIQIQSGFACFPDGDPLNDNAKNVPPLDGFF